jgi:hypothetical protein
MHSPIIDVASIGLTPVSVLAARSAVAASRRGPLVSTCAHAAAAHATDAHRATTPFEPSKDRKQRIGQGYYTERATDTEHRPRAAVTSAPRL